MNKAFTEIQVDQHFAMQVPQPPDPLIIAELQLIVCDQQLVFLDRLRAGATEFLKDLLLVGPLIGRKIPLLRDFFQVPGAEV